MSVCDDILEKLTDYHFDELSDSDRGQVKQHLDSCSSCRDQYREITAVIGNLEEAFSDLPEAPKQLSEDRLAKIHAAANSDGSTEETPAPIVFPKSILISMAACITLVLGITFAVALRRPKDPEIVAHQTPVLTPEEMKLEEERKKQEELVENVGNSVSTPKPTVPDNSGDAKKLTAPAGNGKGKMSQPKADPSDKLDLLADRGEKAARGANAHPEAEEKAPDSNAASPGQGAKGGAATPSGELNAKDLSVRENEKLRKESPADDDADMEDDKIVAKLNPTRRSPAPPAVDPKVPGDVIQRPTKPVPGKKDAEKPIVKEVGKSRTLDKNKPAEDSKPAAEAYLGEAREAMARKRDAVNTILVLGTEDKKKSRSGSRGAEEGATRDIARFKKSKEENETLKDLDSVVEDARKSGLSVTHDSAGLILRPARIREKSVSADSEEQQKALSLRRQFVEVGRAMPKVTADAKRERMSIVGSEKEIRDFEQALQVASGRKRQVAMLDEQAGERKQRKDVGGGAAGMKAAKAVAPKKKKEADAAMPLAKKKHDQKFGAGKSVPTTALPRINLSKVRGDQALATIGRLGKVKIHNQVGEIDQLLAINIEQLTAQEGIKLVCRALDVNVTFVGDAAVITSGPYRADLGAAVYRLSGKQAKTVGFGEALKSADLKRILAQKGVTLSSGAALSYDPNTRTLVLRGDTTDLQRVDDLLK